MNRNLNNVGINLWRQSIEFNLRVKATNRWKEEARTNNIKNNSRAPQKEPRQPILITGLFCPGGVLALLFFIQPNSYIQFVNTLEVILRYWKECNPPQYLH